MMNNRVDLPTVLAAFDKVTELGERKDGGFELDGLYVSSGFDGYEISVTDHIAKLHILFHNKYQLEGPTQQDVEHLLNKISAISHHH